MENASKALIIAGAILISIVLIAVGVMVVNGANGAIDTAVGSMSDHEKTIFNQKFEPYEGTKKGSSVKSLISTIIASNATVEESGSGLKVTINGTENSGKYEGGADAGDFSATIKNAQTYSVTLNYVNGVVANVKIE